MSVSGDNLRADAAKLRERAAKASHRATGLRDRSRAIGEHIPMGQPILVGHHSERRHRRDVARMNAMESKIVEAFDEAKSLTARAASKESTAVRQDRECSGEADQERAIVARIGKALQAVKKAGAATYVRKNTATKAIGVARASYVLGIPGGGMVDVWIQADRVEIGLLYSHHGHIVVGHGGDEARVVDLVTAFLGRRS